MTDRVRSVVVHGHFYQPPRDDPWLGEVPREPSAAPQHDWNERVTRECYRAVVAARLQTGDGKIADIVNALRTMSFDVGATLASWLERADPFTYAAIVEADRASVGPDGGHGNAIAAPYHHVILPLAERRDKVTEVRWGIADFRRRFGRAPEGMWLPETAVDDETLDVLAAEGIQFTVLAPHQVHTVPPDGTPGSYRTVAGHTIALFCYDGALSHDVAFGDLLQDAGRWAQRVTESTANVVTMAVDGETFGHHHRFGEMALASLLDRLGRRPHVTVLNYAAALQRAPAREHAKLVAPSSWSCPHGVERWRSDCGCKGHPETPSNQRWRAVLREALDRLAAELHGIYEAQASRLFDDPWAVRDAYGDALSTGGDAIREFARKRAKSDDPHASVRAAELLEMERHALAMFTSCGWFFDDIGGVESRIVLRHAARAIELSRVPGLEARLRTDLERAQSNDPAIGTGTKVYDAERPGLPAPVRVAAGCAAALAVGEEPAAAVPPAFSADLDGGSVLVRHRATGARQRYRTAVERAGAARLAISVTDDTGAGEWTLTLKDAPETARALVTRALARSAVETWFSPDERSALDAGDAFLVVVARALDRAVALLADDRSEPAATRVLDLLDVFDLFDTPFPFECQTAFFDIWTDTSPDNRTALAEIHQRLGFA